MVPEVRREGDHLAGAEVSVSHVWVDTCDTHAHVHAHEHVHAHVTRGYVAGVCSAVLVFGSACNQLYCKSSPIRVPSRRGGTQ